MHRRRKDSGSILRGLGKVDSVQYCVGNLILFHYRHEMYSTHQLNNGSHVGPFAMQPAVATLPSKKFGDSVT
jgi:hypothetical protein